MKHRFWSERIDCVNTNNFKLEFGSGVKVIVMSSKSKNCIFKDDEDVLYLNHKTYNRHNLQRKSG